MTKSDLKRISGISTASIAKLGKGENITTNVLLKICKALNCGINDIMDMEEDEDFQQKNSMVNEKDHNRVIVNYPLILWWSKEGWKLMALELKQDKDILK